MLKTKKILNSIRIEFTYGGYLQSLRTDSILFSLAILLKAPVWGFMLPRNS